VIKFGVLHNVKSSLRFTVLIGVQVVLYFISSQAIGCFLFL